MRREDFDHIIGAAAEATGQDEFVVVGSQAIVGAQDEPPDSLLESLEADIYPLHDPEGANAIDGALGEGSQFHVAFGYYAHGVGPDTARAPRGWQERLVRVDVPPRPGSTRAPVAWCLESHDLVLAKSVAGRERDWDYVAEALRARIVDVNVLLARVPDLPVAQEVRDHIDRALRGIATQVQG